MVTRTSIYSFIVTFVFFQQSSFMNSKGLKNWDISKTVFKNSIYGFIKCQILQSTHFCIFFINFKNQNHIDITNGK